MDKIIISAEDMRDIENNLVKEILSAHPDMGQLVIAGIQRRGADIAKRLASRLKASGATPELGSLDINLYRDDWTCPEGIPRVGVSEMPGCISGKTVLLVDDVLFTGRTARAALEATLDYGRPAKIELLVFVDRGHRELPIAATIVGKTVPTQKSWHIDVLLKERDGQDAVIARGLPD